jgi:hypothetical protein
MAASQLQHRQHLERTVIEGNVSAERRGQGWAGTLGTIAIVGGIGLIAFDKEVTGLVSILSTLVTLATVFIVGRLRQEAERKRKREEVDKQIKLPLSS